MKYKTDEVLAKEFMRLGLTMLRKPTNGSMRTQQRRFRSAFGTSSTVCAILWHAIDVPIQKPIIKNYCYLLWTLHFMKVYSTEHNHIATLGIHSEKTFRKWVWIYAESISFLTAELVSKQIMHFLSFQKTSMPLLVLFFY